MRNALGYAGLIATLLPGGPRRFAGPWEDGMVAYNRGDYVPAMKLFRPLAQAGNAKAQNVIGVMYHKGEGVARSSARAFMWFSLAARKGDAGEGEPAGNVKGHEPAEMSQAKEMMAACEASNYRDCAY